MTDRERSRLRLLAGNDQGWAGARAAVCRKGRAASGELIALLADLVADGDEVDLGVLSGDDAGLVANLALLALAELAVRIADPEDLP